jgi:hypothetical protein
MKYNVGQQLVTRPGFFTYPKNRRGIVEVVGTHNGNVVLKKVLGFEDNNDNKLMMYTASETEELFELSDSHTTEISDGRGGKVRVTVPA